MTPANQKSMRPKPRSVLQERPSLGNIPPPPPPPPPNPPHSDSSKKRNPGPPLKQQVVRNPTRSGSISTTTTGNSNATAGNAFRKEKDGCNALLGKDLVSQRKASSTTARCARPSSTPLSRSSPAQGQAKDSREEIMQQQQKPTENARIKSHTRRLHSTKRISPKQLRRLSLVLKHERKLEAQSKQFELVFEELYGRFAKKDEEMASIRNAGSMLRELYWKQEQDVKTLQAALPITEKETAHLRELYKDQEKQLAEARAAIPSLQDKVDTLTEQLKSLALDLAQLKCEKYAKSTFEQGKSYEVISSDQVTRTSCSENMTTKVQPETSPERRALSRMHRNQLTFVPSNENLRQSGLKCEMDTNSTFEQEKSYQREERSKTTRSSCSDNMIAQEQREASPEPCTVSKLHKNGLIFVQPNEKRQSGGPREFGRKFLSDKNSTQTLQELSQVADRDEVAMEERCESSFKDFRSSSSRFTSLDSLKLMLKCTSPRLNSSRPSSPRLNIESADNKRNEFARKSDKYGVYTWNLKPT